MKIRIVLIVCLGLVFALAAQAKPAVSQDAATAAEPAPGSSQIILGLHQEPNTLNSLAINMAASNEVISMFSEGLFEVDPDGNWYPVLAKELPTRANGGISQDGLTITFRLRDDIVWSDGEPFRCADVLFTYEAIVHPSNGAWSGSAFQSVDSVTCTDDYTAAVRFKWPIVGATELFGMDILPRHAIGNPANLEEWAFNQQPIGTGPFRFVEWIPGDHITLVKNERYRDYPDKPAVDTIVVRFVPPTLESVQLLREGEIDILWFFAVDSTQSDVADDPAITIYERKGGGVERLVLNLADPTVDASEDPASQPHWALGQVEVRRAIQYGIDKQSIVDRIPGAAAVGTSELSSGWAQCDIEPSPYDPDAARALLEAAGWIDEDKDGVRECVGCAYAEPGTPLRLKIQTTAGNEVRESVEEMLAEMMLDIGIELYAENLPPTELFGGWDNKASSAHGNFDILMFTRGGNVEPQGTMWGAYHSSQIPTYGNSGSGSNYSRWSDETTDAALIKASSNLDRETRRAAYQVVCERLAEDLPSIYLYDRAESHLARTEIRGFEPNPFGPETWNVSEWSREAPAELAEILPEPVLIEGQYTVPVTLTVGAGQAVTAPVTAQVELVLDLRLALDPSGFAVISDSLTLAGISGLPDEAPVGVAVAQIAKVGELTTIVPLAPTPLPSPTPTVEVLSGTVNRNANLRGGPGTSYAIVGAVQKGQTVTIVDESEDGTWYELEGGEWIAAFLVDDVAPATAEP